MVSLQEYADEPKGSILGLTLFLLHIIELPDDVIYNIAICADNATLYAKFGQTPEFSEQLQLASELLPLGYCGLR